MVKHCSDVSTDNSCTTGKNKTAQTIFTVVVYKVMEYELSIGDTDLDFYLHDHNRQNKVVLVLPWSGYQCLIWHEKQQFSELLEECTTLCLGECFVPLLTNTLYFLSCLFWTGPLLHLSAQVSPSYTPSVEKNTDALHRLGYTGCWFSGQHTDTKEKLTLYEMRAETHRLHN